MDAGAFALPHDGLDMSGDEDVLETSVLAVADDLAGPAFFLASPDSDFMTGQTILVDGGLRHN